MNDRELLELAAKAAGMGMFDFERSRHRTWRVGDTDWNPLTDDGDALRLAVKLHMSISIGHRFAFANNSTEYFNDNGNDPYAATRCAIVRAAAEIGKAMP